MALGCIGLFVGMHLLPVDASQHWLSYMLPVASACAGLAFIMGPATSYALEPYSDEAGIASALVGFVQMAIGSCIALVAIALPMAAKPALALVMLLGAVLALSARLLSSKLKGRVKSVHQA